jgi:hypothetical protein
MAVCLWLLAAAQGGQEEALAPGRYVVKVRQAPLKERPALLAPTLAMLAEGAQIEIEEVAGPWARGRAGNAEGWIHTSAIIERRQYRPLEGTRAAAETAGDYMAVKGFNPEAERIRQRGMEPAYQIVDRIERTPPWTQSADDAARVVAEFRRSRGFAP